MNFKITSLSENTVPQGGKELIGEHGLSFYIEAGKHKILFDTGQGIVLANNAGVMGIDLSRIDRVILSHGHYDHSGGLKRLMEHNTEFVLHAHPEVFAQKLKSVDAGYKFIGMPVDQRSLDQKGINLKLDDKAVQIVPGIMSTGEIPQKNDFEEVEPVFLIQNETKVTPDNLADDQAIVLDTSKGLVVLLGCSHRGIVNTLNHVVSLTGKKTIHAILGGLHLGKVPDLKLRKIVAHLAEFGLEKIGVGHCTGPRAFLALSNGFPDRVFLNTVGNVMIF